MTRVLIITNKQDLTSDFIIKELKEREIDFYRFNTEELNSTCSVTLDIAEDKFVLFDQVSKKSYDLKLFTSVYFRRPEIPTFDTKSLTNGEMQFIKSEIAYTLEGIYKILRNAYWVSPIYSIREAENKIFQLEIAKSIGFNIPDSIVTNSFSDAIEFYDTLNGDCIIKPIKSGLIEDSDNPKVIFTNALTVRPSSKEQIEFSPNFFQRHIAKKFDVRVTVVGDTTFATLIHSQNNSKTKIDWRRGENRLKHTKTKLPDFIQEKCVLMLKELNLRFGAIDLILDKKNEYTFLEINPNGQWAWIEKQSGHRISKEIVNLLENENF
jgi:glutathione synthase/RimK-type ligase-like ATP-grasp enzyme